MERKQTALGAFAIFGLLVLLGGTSSHAQEGAKPQPASEQTAAETDAETAATDTAAADTAAADPQPSPPVFGMETSGTLDIGYRWNAGLRGNQDMYRTLVNLGEGPRLLGANLTMSNPLG